MIPKECKRLIEVDFPIATVSKHSAREKSIRHGHPSTLHLWWARRPLAACRSVLLGLLLPDPCDPHCPKEFKIQARKTFQSIYLDAKSDEELQKMLLKFIGDFANWDNANDPQYLRVGRELVKAAHPEETPLVVDPFAGGGSIPLEALRLGCDAFASDLNPVACLIQKVMLEDIPRYGPKLAEELRKAGAEIKDAAEKELAEFYPPDPDGAKPIAYLWARTVRCEAPDCGAEIPLVRTNWLAKRYNKNKHIYTKLVSLDINGDKTTKKVDINITIHPTPSHTLPKIPGPTIAGGKATCPCCGKLLSDKHVRNQLYSQGGGSDAIFNSQGVHTGGAKLMAVILRKNGLDGLQYRLSTEEDIAIIRNVEKKLHDEIKGKRMMPLPSEPLSPIRPSPNARGVSGATRIGITNYGALFTRRQHLALSIISNIVQKNIASDAIQDILYLSISKLSERSSSFVTWINSTEAPRGTFARQALTIAWDFIELVPIADDEEFKELIDAMVHVVEHITEANIGVGQVAQFDATDSPLPDDSVKIWFTDPPYYDSVPYADLSDLFFIWLKRMLNNTKFNKIDSITQLTPKLEECTWNQAHVINGNGKTPEYFEITVSKAFAQGRRILSEDGIGCIVFAHKSTDGWEKLLSGIQNGGWIIVSSWPITTERKARLNAKESAALISSVHLIVRPRPDNAPIGDWSDVLRELPKRVGAWMERLQNEGVRGADLVFACIGPALEIYSKYSKVETAEGRVVELPEYLAKVWEVVGRKALENILGTAESKARNGAAGALEEDARLTALFLWTLQSTAIDDGGTSGEEEDEPEAEEDEGGEGAKKKKKGSYSLIYDVVRRFSQPLGIGLDKWEGRIIETDKGVVRLLPIGERTKQLFGDEGAQAMADRIEEKPKGPIQMKLFADENAAPEIKGRKRSKKGKDVSDEELKTRYEATTLDKVHAAMLLQANGRTNALRALIEAEQDRGPEFMRLANALSALYPPKSEEKRLLDAMILAAPR